MPLMQTRSHSRIVFVGDAIGGPPVRVLVLVLEAVGATSHRE